MKRNTDETKRGNPLQEGDEMKNEIMKLLENMSEGQLRVALIFLQSFCS